MSTTSSASSPRCKVSWGAKCVESNPEIAGFIRFLAPGTPFLLTLQPGAPSLPTTGLTHNSASRVQVPRLARPEPSVARRQVGIDRTQPRPRVGRLISRWRASRWTSAAHRKQRCWVRRINRACKRAQWQSRRILICRVTRRDHHVCSLKVVSKMHLF